MSIEFLTALKRNVRVLNLYPDLNKGGCGWAAYNLYMALTNAGIEAHIGVVNYGEGHDKEGINKRAKYSAETGDCAKAPCEHIVVVVEGQAIDSNGSYYRKPLYKEWMEVDNLKAMLDNRELWNGAFYHSNQHSDWMHDMPEVAKDIVEHSIEESQDVQHATVRSIQAIQPSGAGL